MAATTTVLFMLGVLLPQGEGSSCNQYDEQECDSPPGLSLLQHKASKLQGGSAVSDDQSLPWFVASGPCDTSVIPAATVPSPGYVVKPLAEAPAKKAPAKKAPAKKAAAPAPCSENLDGNVALGVAETRSEKGCTPICTWSCNSVPCAEVCEPQCEQPMCQTRCTPEANLKGCAMTCNEPKCTTFCRKPCADATCPWCTTDCGKPECSMKCPQYCHEVCNSPLCKWNCIKPKCPAPDCTMTCESAKCAIGGGYRDFPALKAGEIIVNTFAAPRGTTLPFAAPSILGTILLQEQSGGNKTSAMLAVNISRAVLVPGSDKLTIIHDTIDLPVSPPF